MDFVNRDDVFVILCDWHGRLVWSSTPLHVEFGEPVWQYLSGAARESLKVVLSQVIALCEPHLLEVETDSKTRFRLSLWPLNKPEIAVCVLATGIPPEMSRLSQSELKCLECLAQGLTTQRIAVKLCISESTLHTHLRRSRQKLAIRDLKELTVFAARHCYVPIAEENQSRPSDN